MVATVLLSIVAYLSKPYLQEQANPPLEFAVQIVILVLGIGAVIWRRTKLATMRLQDIAGLAGPSGLLKTLEKTTIQMALLGAAIALAGFIATLAMGSEGYTYWAGVIALVVFLYSYPRKSFWLRIVDWFTKTPDESPTT